MNSALNLINFCFAIYCCVVIAACLGVGFGMPIIRKKGIRVLKRNVFATEGLLAIMRIFNFLAISAWLMANYAARSQWSWLVPTIFISLIIGLVFEYASQYLCEIFVCIGILLRVVYLKLLLIFKYQKNGRGEFVEKYELTIVTDLTTGYLWGRINLGEFFRIEDSEGNPVVAKQIKDYEINDYGDLVIEDISDQ